MRDYLTTLLLVSAVTAVLSVLPSEGPVKKAAALALSLSVLSAVVLPLPSLLAGRDGDLSDLLAELRGETVAGSDWLKNETLSATAEGIREHLCREYGLSSDELTVTVEGDLIDNTVILARVTLWLTGRAAAADVPRIVRAIEADTGAECCVEYPK